MAAPAPAPTDEGSAAEFADLERAVAADRASRERQGTAPPVSGARDAAVGQSPAAAAPGALARTFQSLNPDLSFIADVALGVFSGGADPPVVGAHDPNKTGFTLQQLELAVGAAVDPYFRFDAYLVFSQFGVEIEEVYATTLSLPLNLQARLGQFLTRFGRINATHPHTWQFTNQPLVIGKLFGGEGNRGLGAELSALLPLPWYVELVGSVTDAAGASTARSFFGGDDLGVSSITDFQYTGALKQFFPLSENWSLAVGFSAATGPNPTGRANFSNIYGADVYLKYRPITRGSSTVVSLDAEWLVRRRQVPHDLLTDRGLYAVLFWRFAQRWAVAARYERVDGLADDPLDPQWTAARQRLGANLTFWPTEFSRLRLQLDHDRPGWVAPYWSAVLAMEFAVGAHGAHKF